MTDFLQRLRLAYLVLTARRLLLFVPTGPGESFIGQGQPMSANDWVSLASFSGHYAQLACMAAEKRLLAEMDDACEIARIQALENEINTILFND